LVHPRQGEAFSLDLGHQASPSEKFTTLIPGEETFFEERSYSSNQISMFCVATVLAGCNVAIPEHSLEQQRCLHWSRARSYYEYIS